MTAPVVDRFVARAARLVDDFIREHGLDPSIVPRARWIQIVAHHLRSGGDAAAVPALIERLVARHDDGERARLAYLKNARDRYRAAREAGGYVGRLGGAAESEPRNESEE